MKIFIFKHYVIYNYIFMERCVELYNEILDNIKNIVKHDTSLLKEASIELKQSRLNSFHESLTDESLFVLFSKSKIKVFSGKTDETHAISCSLFTEELTLKQVFNNQTDIIKNQFWDRLYRLYIEIDKTKTVNNERFSLLLDRIKDITQTLSNKVKNDILKVDVNNTTNNMIDDIVGSFQNMMNNKSNPFDNIMNITNMISDKYKNQLQNGDIQLDKIMGGIDGVLPGLMKQHEAKVEPVIIDENFSTSNVDIGVEGEESKGGISNMMKMLPNMGGLMSMVSRINTAENNDDLVNIKKDMDHFLEKELKVDMKQFNETMNNIEKKMEDVKIDTEVVEH